MRSLVLAAALCATSVASAKAPDLSNIGPAPDRDAGIAMIESTIREQLKDPDSAKFAWPNGFVAGWYQIPFGHRYVGWITCGTMNAKNGYGGYAGSTAVVGIISNGAVIGTDVDEPAYGSRGFVSEACKKIGVPVG